MCALFQESGKTVVGGAGVAREVGEEKHHQSKVGGNERQNLCVQPQPSA